MKDLTHYFKNAEQTESSVQCDVSVESPAAVPEDRNSSKMNINKALRVVNEEAAEFVSKSKQVAEKKSGNVGGYKTRGYHKKYKNRKSDAAVTNATDMASTRLLIIMPDKKVDNGELSESNTKIKDTKIQGDKEPKAKKNKKSKDKKESKICGKIALNTSAEDFESVEDGKISLSSTKKTRSKVHEKSSTKNTEEIKVCTPKMNAFEFMMDSRHKSIGRNSPGKELKETEEEQLKEDKKALRDRKSLLQTWSDKKGGVKRKQQEEEIESCIVYKLETRAKRLRKLLNNKPNSNEEKKATKKDRHKRKIATDSDSSFEASKTKKIKTKKRIYVQDDSESNNHDKDGDEVDERFNFSGIFSKSAEEEKETKVADTKNDNSACENRLSLEKKQMEMTAFLGLFNTSMDSMKNSNGKKKKTASERSAEETVDTKIKVRSSKVDKKKKKSLVAIKSIDSGIIIEDNSSQSREEKKKHKRIKEKKKNKNSKKDEHKANDTEKKPSKTWQMKVKILNDDTISSDIEIGTKRKRKCRSIQVDCIELSSTSADEMEIKKIEKIAPVFLKSTPRRKEDPAVLEAKKNFLHSGIPESLRKVIERQQVIDNIEVEVFPKISHIQQKTDCISGDIDFWNLPPVYIKMQNNPMPIEDIGKLKLGTITNSTMIEERKLLRGKSEIKNLHGILKQIKNEFPEYPVYKVFKSLKEKYKFKEEIKEVVTQPPKKGRKRKKKHVLDDSIEIVEPKKSVIENNRGSMMWTEKYKATTSEDIIGNNTAIKELKNWINSWLEFKRECSSKRSKYNSSESDFDTEIDTRDSSCGPENSVILTGPAGCGKTMAVYAVCSELGINVLELNASSKRTGKRLLQELQEATQSHQVKEGSSKILKSFLQNAKKHAHQKKSVQVADAASAKKMCLLLVEDVDIVFEQDEGFISALAQLLSTSKRPVILTTSDPDMPHLQRFVNLYSVIKFKRLTPRVSATWLQIVCLLEGVYVNRDALGELLEMHKGDIRRSLLQLQLWVQTGGQWQVSHIENKPCSINYTESNEDDCFMQDDCSNSFINDDEIVETRDEDCKAHFVDDNVNLNTHWWNLPQFFDNKQSLSVAQKAFDRFLHADILLNRVRNDADCLLRYDNFTLTDSLELEENMTNYSGGRELICEIGDYLANDQKLNKNVGLANSEMIRCHSNQQNCNKALSEAIPLPYLIDRKSVSMDYLPILRNISRSETLRASNTRKRKNRFYNYLQGLGINCNERILSTANSVFSKDAS